MDQSINVKKDFDVPDPVYASENFDASTTMIAAFFEEP